MTVLYNRKPETIKRKSLRNSTTRSEKILWQKINKRQILGIKFRRQYGISSYVLDFYSPETRIAIEIDGGIHKKPEVTKSDKMRQQQIEYLGIRVLRFSVSDVENNISDVIIKIKREIMSSPFIRGRNKEGV